jgi:hypothetical protein
MHVLNCTVPKDTPKIYETCSVLKEVNLCWGCLNRIHLYNTVILYGCETWCRALREEKGLRVFGNRVLRKICGSRREEKPRDWSGLLNGKLPDL